MKFNFEFHLFCSSPQMAQEALLGSIDRLIVDWECKGKKERQKNFNTQINGQLIEDLRAISSTSKLPVICRINPVGSYTQAEVNEAIANGADEILVPMVQNKQEVERVLDYSRDRKKVGILIETRSAAHFAKQFSNLPLSRIYVGLNDLSIENNERNIFLPLANGMLETIREQITHPFGFGGLTLPHLGFPIPCQLLIDEMVRLGSSFSFLRRSFLQDTKEKNFRPAIETIRRAIEQSIQKKEKERQLSRQRLLEKIEKAWLYF
ncbi:MAG TPA: aldolase/citrate lyase family protein [Chlamydiales bacterium]|nr:aldolase/citrate lyase family protein [Chlamydiales bacterium]